MWKKYKYHISIIFFVVAIWLIEAGKPKEINWFASFSRYDKIPYGSYVLYEMLDDLFHDHITSSDEKLEKTLVDHDAGNYIFINNELNLNQNELHAFLDFVSEGHNAFIAAGHIDRQLTDTLQLTVNTALNKEVLDSVRLNIYQTGTSHTYAYERMIYTNRFDTTGFKGQVLGGMGNGSINFIKVPFQDGQVFINLNPHAFTNFHMLKDNNHEYVSAALSHLPDGDVIWDEYYKNRDMTTIRPPLIMISQTKGLRQALQLALLALLTYILFNIKRKQRVIPVMAPKRNTTVDFTKTIGKLYFEVHDNKDMGRKRIEYFLSDIRKRYQLPTDRLDKDFCQKLSTLSGVPQKEVDALIRNFNIIYGAPEIKDERIVELDRLIENFNKNKL